MKRKRKSVFILVLGAAIVVIIGLMIIAGVIIAKSKPARNEVISPPLNFITWDDRMNDINWVEKYYPDMQSSLKWYYQNQGTDIIAQSRMTSENLIMEIEYGEFLMATFLADSYSGAEYVTTFFHLKDGYFSNPAGHYNWSVNGPFTTLGYELSDLICEGIGQSYRMRQLTAMFNEDKPILFGVVEDSNIYDLTIMGMPPDVIIPKEFNGSTVYFWMYTNLDFTSIIDNYDSIESVTYFELINLFVIVN